MAEEYDEKDIYVLLDFQGKDTTRFLKQQNVYFRMLNLNESKPIIEIGDDVYEGIYDDAVGTNVYFEEVEDPPPNPNIFEGATPITIQYLLKQTKLLKMKKIGTKPKPVIDTGPTETVNIHIKDDYRVLLEKFEQDKLNIDECVTANAVVETNSDDEPLSDKTDDNEEEESHVEKNFQWEASRLPPRQNLKPDWFTTMNENTSGTNDTPLNQETQKNPTYLKYEKLQKVAEQPTRRNILHEAIEDDRYEQPLHSLPKNDFIVWKNSILQSVEQQPINLDLNKDKTEDFVDTEKSIEAGIIAPSNENPRTFTKEEKQKLLSFKNFINISPLMKLVMLQDFVQLEKATMQTMTEEELNKKGEDECTSNERFELLKRFKEELETLIISRLRDAQANDETLERLEDFKLELPEDELTDAGFSYSSDDSEHDEQLSDSKGEDESMSTDISESEQQQLEEQTSNVSDIEVNTNTATNISQENSD